MFSQLFSSSESKPLPWQEKWLVATQTQESSTTKHQISLISRHSTIRHSEDHRPAFQRQSKRYSVWTVDFSALVSQRWLLQTVVTTSILAKSSRSRILTSQHRRLCSTTDKSFSTSLNGDCSTWSTQPLSMTWSTRISRWLEAVRLLSSNPIFSQWTFITSILPLWISYFSIRGKADRFPPSPANTIKKELSTLCCFTTIVQSWWGRGT